MSVQEINPHVRRNLGKICACQLRRDGVPVLNARYVAPEQTSALLYVALTEFLLFPKFAESLAYDHAGIIPSWRGEGKECGEVILHRHPLGSCIGLVSRSWLSV
jgi:hypothetical protein